MSGASLQLEPFRSSPLVLYCSGCEVTEIAPRTMFFESSTVVVQSAIRKHARYDYMYCASDYVLDALVYITIDLLPL